MRRIRLAILTPLLVCGACTQIKAVTSTTPSVAPSTTVDTAAESLPPGFADPSATPTTSQAASNAPVVLPTLRVGGTQAQPEPSFTPAVIVPLGGKTPTPTPCASGASCAPTATPTFAPGVSPAPSSNVSTAPGSPTPKPTGTPFPSLKTIAITNQAAAGIDLVNNLWLGDTAKKTASVYTAGGDIQGTFNVEGPPGALAFDKDGNVWVQSADLASLVELDRFGNRIDKYTLTIAEPGAEGRPGLAAVPTGGMWVSNGGGANTVMRVDDKGKEATTIEAENGVAAIASDAGGNVWIVGSARGTKLSKFSPTGTPLGVFDDSAGLEDPKAAKIDASGNLWVIGRRTVVPQPTEGFVVVFAGTGARIATISTGVDRFPVAFDFGLQGDIVIANGPNGLSTEHAGFQRVTKEAGVKVEKLYNAPTGVLVDKNGDVWGLNAAREAFRFKL